MLFSVVIPNYNSEKYILRLLESISDQTFVDFEIIIVDDISQDNSLELIKNYNDTRLKLFINDRKRYNGGTRNEGVKHAVGEYILFADCDDYFASNECFKKIADVIYQTNKPDLVRLPYTYLVEGGMGNVILHEENLEKLTQTQFVAPWTKCIKRELFVDFPENTLIEDVSQHIEQMDKIKNIAYVDIPIIVWNRLNEKAISNPNQEIKSIKRQASYWRIIADLMELDLKHDYCKSHRDWRLQNYLNMARERLK